MIESSRLIIRKFNIDDLNDLKEYISQKEVMKYESEWDTDDESLKGDIEYFSKGDNFWAVELKDEKKLIGHLYFGDHGPEHFKTKMIGYIFNPSYYGNGYATEACEEFFNYAFKELDVHRIIAKCNPENIKSWKVLERLQMRFEGKSLKSMTIKNDSDGNPIWWDEFTYGILNEEWIKNRGGEV